MNESDVIHVRGKKISLLLKVQNYPGTHPANYSVGTEDSFSGGK